MKLTDYIDHTLLDPKANKAEVEEFVQECHVFRFYGVCLPAYWMKVASGIVVKKSKLKRRKCIR